MGSRQIGKVIWKVFVLTVRRAGTDVRTPLWARRYIQIGVAIVLLLILVRGGLGSAGRKLCGGKKPRARAARRTPYFPRAATS